MGKPKDDLHASHLALARRGVSRTLRSTALLMLLVGLGIYLLMWWSALRMHLVPSSWSGSGAGNHGPWRHTGLFSGLRNLRQLWHNVLWAFSCASLASLLALALAPSWPRARLLILCLGLTGLYLFTHSWLVD